MFHCLAGQCADMMVGASPSDRSERAWHQVYRALEHRDAYKRCRDRNFIVRFDQTIQDFANLFHVLQDRRHTADYDVSASPLLRSAVESDILQAETAISVLLSAEEKDRRAFCTYVLFSQRPHPAQAPQSRP